MGIDKRGDLGRRGHRPQGTCERTARQRQMQADIGFRMCPRKGCDAVKVTARHHGAAGIDTPACQTGEEGIIHTPGQSQIIGMHDKQSCAGTISQPFGERDACGARFNKSHAGTPRRRIPDSIPGFEGEARGRPWRPRFTQKPQKATQRPGHVSLSDHGATISPSIQVAAHDQRRRRSTVYRRGDVHVCLLRQGIPAGGLMRKLLPGL